MASILRAEDKYDAAIDYIRNILTLNSADGESWSSLGMCHIFPP
jgi:Flp pilus assembly protein TadD